jgi:glycosyltransferase involved in cell wall biosynthesis/2-polyprenyl-3-methyl-5-hydroxy-6-metoxy-1,4-benzoquinol methylase
VDVVIYSAGIPFNGNTVQSKSLGGSESAAYYLARELARRGNRVKCFTSSREPDAIIDGVAYLYHGDPSQEHPLGDRFETYAINSPHDVLIIQRLPFAFHKQYAAKICIWQLHDLALYRSAPQILGGMWQTDVVTTVSDWHGEQVKSIYNINPAVLRTVPNGVDPSLYTGKPDDALLLVHSNEGPFGRTEKDITVPLGRFLLLYQSRPERGLNHALDLMQRAQDEGLPVQLLVCSYDGVAPQMQAYYSSLYERAKSLNNVTLLGSLSKPQLAALQRQCDLLLYPTVFEEVSCITAMEAMHAGLPMLTSAHAALPETCAGSGTLLVPTKDGEVDYEGFWNHLTGFFGLVKPGEYPEELQALKQKQLAAAPLHTWSSAADRLLAVIDEAFEKRRSSPGAILRDAIEHSDIGFAQWYINEKLGGPYAKHDPIVRSVIGELDRLYSFTESPESFAAQYVDHQREYYEKFGEQVSGEDVTHSTRYRGVLNFFAEQHNRKKGEPLRVLDYGCSHGHYLVPLAKTFPMHDFVGVDISQYALTACDEWIKREQLENVKTIQAADAKDERLGRFDIIYAGEVLEHVTDYASLLNQFRELLDPGGCIVVTTPTGRWEYTGTESFRNTREHLHLFERADIDDICAGHELEVLQAPAGTERNGWAMGSWVWCVWPKGDLPLWSVNYERKLKTVAPRQTVSACLIVKNGEDTLRRCVESFVDWVDEIVICIDPSTDDRTLEVCAQLETDFPNRPFLYAIAEKSASVDGFEAARNESIAKASGDWIMWIDADEELRTPWMLHKLLRPSMHNGYGFPQVHYSVDPEQVLTTDFPCRLFRNHIGVQFYGMVHEHPESEVSKAVAYSLVRHEVKFLHRGYFDELTRRARYSRNLPLLKRDLEKYPTERPLNKFLMLRDIAQGIQFDAEQNSGYSLPRHIEEAKRGIKIMEQIAQLPQLKMISDAMPYYSLCVATTGSGFDADLTMKVRSPQAPDLAVSMELKGRFHSREFFSTLVNKFSQESTRYYEDRHL